MKKALIFCAAALLLALGACKEKEDPNKIDWDAVTVNGFYVAGPATGSDEIKGDCVMTAGFNEEGKSLREGMYEKYIVLEADKDFYLLFNDGGKKSRYSADLKLFETPLEEAYGDNPASVLKGALEVGEDAKPMRVSKTGLYHIVLDKNQMGDLNNSGGAQILLLDASAFQMIGAFGEAESDPAPASFSNDGVTFTFKDVKLMKDAWFKFRTGKYWKVTLDDAGKVKAEVSLGEGMSQNGGNLTVDKSGIYDVTLTFKLAGGGFDRSFSYKTEFKEAVAEFPEWAGIYGNYSGHNWNVDGAEPVKIGAKSGEEGTGVYKGVITMVGGTGFKVFADGAWLGGSMDNLSDGADLVMAEEGTFYVEINLKDSPKTIKFEKITSVGIIGDATSTGWSDETKLPYDEAKRVFSGPVTFVEGGSFKIRFNENWDLNYGGTLDALKYVGDNIPGPGAGVMRVTLDFANDASIKVEEGGFASHFGINWDNVDCVAAGDTNEGRDGVKSMKVTADASRAYVLVEVKKDILVWDAHQYANRSYFCVADAGEGGDRWTQNPEKKIEGWLLYNAEPYFINWQDSIVDKRAYTAIVDDVVYFEVAIDRSTLNCLKKTEAAKAYFGFFMTDTYNDGSTAGSRAENGFAPAKGESMLEVSLPAFGA